ncbi:unnamed protein product, partial [Ascophyllum nodosum]
PCPRPRCRSLLPRGCGSCGGEDATSARARKENSRVSTAGEAQQQAMPEGGSA